MSIRLCLSLVTASTIVVLGCGQNAQPVGPSLTPSVVVRNDTAPTGTTGSLAALVAGVEHTVSLFDACDPETFNAALGAGTCIRSGGMRFENFLAELGSHHSVGAWHMAPGVVQMQVGQKLVAINNGGETHTFTEVDEFGGGIIPVLNDLGGFGPTAPECNQLPPGAMLAPGARSSETEEEGGVEKYQCCIHPWMRAEVRIAEKEK